MAGFGSVWFFLGLAAVTQRFYWWFLAPAVVPVLLIWISIQRLRTPVPPISDEQRPRVKKIRRWFGIINAIQWTAIGILAFGLGSRGRQDLIVPAVVIVVALHFFPLAAIFHAPLHYVTGALLLLWVLICYRVPFASGDLRSAAIALGTGVLLWVAGALGLAGIGRRAKAA